MQVSVDLSEIDAFLLCETPDSWVKQALDNPDILLIDHAHCEKKAAASALNLLFHYPDYADLLVPLSKLAREELRHFEQVIRLMQKRGVSYQHLTPAKYASSLRKSVRDHDPERLVDLLIVAAIIEARSCERFARLVPVIDDELAQFYHGLLACEARHYQLYLSMAKQCAQAPIEQRIAVFLRAELDFIMTPDDEFRFHSA